jgi:phosphate transport system substrate-binding protein
VAVLLGGSACGGGGSTQPSQSLKGAGSSLVAPLIAAWSSDYRERADVQVDFNAAGSGIGIQAITLREVDFGASEAPLTPDQTEAAHGVLQIPWALSATVMSYNVPGLKDLKLSGPVISRIFLGTITKWNDPSIAQLNPGVTLPGTPITPIFRSDASGDTYALADYLSKVSPEWKSKVGTSTVVSFPAGAGARGNSGVAGGIARTEGGIGYLAIGYAVENDLRYASVENAAGEFPTPGVPSIEAAGKTVTSLSPANTVSITDPPAAAAGAYPISTFSYAVVPKQSAKAPILKSFLNYAIGEGQSLGKQFQFAPLPEAVVEDDRDTIGKIHS